MSRMADSDPRIKVRRSLDGKRVAIDLRTIPDADWPGPMPDDVNPWLEVRVEAGLCVTALTDGHVADWVEC